MSKVHVKHALILVLGTNLAMFAGPPAEAADPVNLGTVQTTGTGEQQESAQNPESAPYQAPTKVPLDAIQPTSVISQQYIEHNTPLSSNYTDVLAMAPSVYSVNPNGPGLMENQIMSIRGFQDGFYNVTFDGIPWNDSNDFTHHSTSYFMDHDLGPMALDRGPGTAATIGNATFGGTISIASKDPLATTTITPYASFGSWNTQVYGAQFDSGESSKYGGGRLFIDGESLSSDGYLSYASQQRKNLFAKGEQPIGDNTVLTFVGMFNNVFQGVPIGATQAQIAANGPSYGLNNNPDSQAYHGYNQDQIHTDFEYVGLKSVLDSGWAIDNKVYTYAYYHDGFNGEDVNGETPNGTYYNTIGYVNPNDPAGLDVPGQHLVNYYRSWGDTFKLRKDFSFGDVQTGIWGDYQTNTRRLTEIDDTLGGAFNPINVGNALLGIDRELDQTLTTVQPFVQLDWKALPGLTLSPGVRYDYFSRHVDAQVDVKSGIGANYTNNYDSVLPSLLAHYQIAGNWSAYAQVAKGFLAPNENFFNRGPGVNASNSTLQPQTTWNYQLGTVWQSQRLTLGADVYYIDFNNEINPVTVGGITTYTNLGGSTYQGVETEATLYVGSGVSLYANGSVNRTTEKATGMMLPNAPTGTAALGVIYNHAGWYASLMDKWVGDRYGDVNAAVPLSSYSTLDGALDYTFENGLWGSSKPTVKVAFNNLLNSNKIYALAGYTGALGTPLYWTIPERSVFASVSVPF